MSVRKSLYISFISNNFNMMVSFLSAMVIARLLSPNEIGIFSVSVALVGFAQVMRNFGVSKYLIQEGELTRDHVRTASTISFLLGFLFFVGIYGLSYPAARFYEDEGVGRVMRLIAFNFLIVPIGLPAEALLQRNMQFGRLLVVTGSGSAVSAATSISLAALGYSYMSLAWAAIAGTLVTVSVVALLTPQHVFMRPSLRYWRKIVGFGSFATGTQIFTEIGLMAADLILGKVLGFAAAALYSRANGLLSVIRTVILSSSISVALPAFAQQKRTGIDMRSAYLRGTCLITAMTFPIFAFIGITGVPLMHVLFGDQWLESGRIAQILFLSFVVASTFTLSSVLMIAAGFVRENFYREAAIQSFRVLIIVVFCDFGLRHLAGSMLFVMIFGFIITSYYLKNCLSVKAIQVIRACIPSAIVMVCSNIGPFFIVFVLGPILSPFVTLVLCGSLALTGWLLSVFLTSHPIKEEVLITLKTILSAWKPENRWSL